MGYASSFIVQSFNQPHYVPFRPFHLAAGVSDTQGMTPAGSF